MLPDRSTVPKTDSDVKEQIDPETFASLYNEGYPKFWLIAAGITGDRNQADDIVQEAAVVALNNLSRFTAGTNFAAWISEIVRLRALNYVRKLRGRRTVPVDPYQMDRGHPSQPSHSNEPSPAEIAKGSLPDQQTCFDDTVMQALNSVSEVARACLLLRIVHHLSYVEISSIMQILQGTAMSHVHRAKQLLRKLLAEDDPETSRGKVK